MKVQKKVDDKSTKLVEMDVNYLEDPEAVFVSLVPHGANGKSFIILKSEDQEDRIVQRIVIPKSLPTEEADEILKGFATDDEKEYANYLAYDQVDREECEEGSFDGFYLDEKKGVFVITAKAKNLEIGKDLAEKPYPNEHSCRLADPGQFDSFARQNCAQKHDGKCIDVIYGIKGSGKDKTSQIQALRYPTSSWDADDAKAHCKSRGGTFEAAAKKENTNDGKEDRTNVVKEIEELRRYDLRAALIDEAFSMLDIMSGSLGQSKAEDTWLKNTIETATQNFTSFVAMLLESFGPSKVAKAIRSVSGTGIDEKMIESISDDLKKISQKLDMFPAMKFNVRKEDNSMDQLFETKEQVKEFVIEAIKEFEAQKQQDAERQAEIQKAADEKKELKETLEQLQENLKAIDSRLQTLENDVSEPGVTKAASQDTSTQPKTQETDVFKGVIFRKGAIAQ